MEEKTKKGGVYTVKQVAEILQVSDKAIYDLVKKDPPFKVMRIGHSIRINKNSFDEWLDS